MLARSRVHSFCPAETMSPASTYTAVHLAVAATITEVWLSADTWNSLDETQQGWVMEAIAKAYEVNTADAEVEYEDSKAKCIEEGLEFIEFDRKAFEDSANEIAQEMDGEMFSAGLYDRIKALDAE